MNKKQSFALCLALLMLASVACANETPADTTDAETTTTVAQEETTLPLPEVDYGGQEFNLYLWSNGKLPVEEENGDVVNDAIYRRNRAVEDHCNLKFAYNISPGAVADFATWYNTLSASILAGDSSVDLAGGYAYRLASHSLDGNFTNLLELPQLDFSADWWPGNVQEAGNLGGAMYMTIGNIDIDYYDKIFAILFNKNIMQLVEVNGLLLVIGWLGMLQLKKLDYII